METLFYILGTALIFLSWRSFAGGIAYRQYFGEELARPTSDVTPFVSIIAPCRGVDEEMQANLDAVLQQDYPELEVIFVIDDAADPAAEVTDAAGHAAAGP